MRTYAREDSEEKTKNKNKKQESGSDSDSGNSDKEDQKESNKGEKKELFVRNISFKTNEDELSEFFGKFGKVKNVKILTQDGRSKGVGFIEYENTADAEKLIKGNKDLELDGRQISINWANEKRSSPQDRNDEKSKTIFVGNLSFKATESSIEDFFADCGKVTGVRIAKMDDGKSKGFCHVDFEDEEGVENALKKNGEDFEGRNIKVDKTLPRNSDSRGGFRGRDNRGGRSFGNRGGRGYDRGGRGGYEHRDRYDRGHGDHRRNNRSRD